MHVELFTEKGNRPHNEDFVDVFTIHDYCFVVIADGQGGNGGLNAGQLLITELKGAIESLFESPQMASYLDWLIQKAIVATHRVMEGVRKGDGGRYSGFCSAFTLLVFRPLSNPDSRTVSLFHIGNTKAVLLRSGVWNDVTTTHTIASEKLRNGTITPVEYATHPERGVLTQAIGVFQQPEWEYNAFVTEPNDIWLLFSDGVYEALTEEDIRKSLSVSPSPKDACWLMHEGVMSKGGWDNHSIAIVSI